MKKVYILLPLLIFLSCSPYKFKYFTPGGDRLSLSLKEAGYLEENELFFAFVRDFENFEIEVIQNDIEIFGGKIPSQSNFAKELKIDKRYNAVVKFKGIDEPLVISPKQMSGYKYIYFYKINSKVHIYFYDGLFAKDLFFPKHSTKIYNCKIISIDSTESSYLVYFQEKGAFKARRKDVIIIYKRDTVISDREVINVGKSYKFELNDTYYYDISQKNDSDFYENKLIWTKEIDNKVYKPNNLINLYYIDN